MTAILSLDEMLMKARSHANKGDVLEAQVLYQAVLQTKKERIQKELTALKKTQQNNVLQNPPQEALNQLANLYNQEQFQAAVKQAQVLTLEYPQAFVIWNLLGASATQIGMLDQAIIAYKKAILIKPDYTDAYYNMGIALQDQGKLDEAIEAFKKAIFLKPDYSEAYCNMGNALQDQGKLDKAIESYKKSISLKPDYAETYCNVANVYKDQGKLEKSIKAYKKAVSLKPDYADAYNGMGNVLEDQGKLDKAMEAYKKAVSLKPDYADAYNNMGVSLQRQWKLDEALDVFQKIIYFNPNYANAYYNLGVTYHYQGKLEKSFKAYNKAIFFKPDYAEAHQNLGFALLNSGRLKEGLDKYEWRWKTSKFLSKQRQFLQPMWDGKQRLTGKRILIWCEQGVGDTIMWSSSLPLVTFQAEHCILECQTKLIPLLKRSFPNVEVKAEDRSFDLQRDDFDFHLPMGTLYKHFVQEISQKAKTNAYLVPNPAKVHYWRKQLTSLGKGPYVGIGWKSANMSPNRLQNYAPIIELYPILKIPDATFINLQYSDFADDLTKAKDELGITIHNFDDLDHFNNIDDVAALCAALDVVVSTQSTVPLISAGVGTSTKLASWKPSTWNNILHKPVGPLVDKFERNTFEPWKNVFNLIAEDILKL